MLIVKIIYKNAFNLTR